MPTLLRTNLLLNPLGRITGNIDLGPNATVSYESTGAVVTHTNLASPGNAFFAVQCSLVNGTTYYARCKIEDVVSTPSANIAVHGSIGSVIGTATAGTRAGSFVSRDWSIVSTVTGQARLLLDYNGTGAGESYRLKEMYVSTSPFVTYFDGNTPDTAFKIYDWTGAANASTSTESSVLPRPAVEYSAAGLEFEFYSRQSGLSAGTLNDHKFYFYKNTLGMEGSLADLEREYWKTKSGLPATGFSLRDHKMAAFETATAGAYNDNGKTYYAQFFS